MAFVRSEHKRLLPSEPQVVLVWNAPGGTSNQTQPRLVELAAQLWREHGPQAAGGSGLVHSVWANFQVLHGYPSNTVVAEV